MLAVVSMYHFILLLYLLVCHPLLFGSFEALRWHVVPQILLAKISVGHLDKSLVGWKLVFWLLSDAEYMSHLVFGVLLIGDFAHSSG